MGIQRRSIEAVMNMGLISQASCRAELTVTDTAVELVPDSGIYAIEVQNLGNKIIYYGGSNVTSSNGIAFFQDDRKIFTNIENTFSLYLVCASGETSKLRIVEYK